VYGGSDCLLARSKSSASPALHCTSRPELGREREREREPIRATCRAAARRQRRGVVSPPTKVGQLLRTRSLDSCCVHHGLTAGLNSRTAFAMDGNHDAAGRARDALLHPQPRPARRGAGSTSPSPASPGARATFARHGGPRE
jgi:hypothetical protein